MGEKQLAVLQNVPGPRESAILVLCARVLEGYYAGLGHVDSTLAMVENATSTESAREKYDGTAEENQSQAKSGSESGSGPNPTPKAHTKTSLTQIAACGEENCGCCDYDAGVRAQPPAPAPVADPKNPFSSSSSSSYYPDPSSSPPCGCGHPRISHHPSSPSTTALGVARLLHRYTNWHPPAYAALGHRSSTGYRKRSLSKIRVCGAPGTNCPCRDYDKGRRTGRCERCGHYDNVHVAAHIWRGEQTSERRGDKARNGEIGAGLDQKGEWELSWILIENAYILLNQMDHLVT
jgi:hypothetical protein